jgi:mannose-1-phosphate guanylyltransferase
MIAIIIAGGSGSRLWPLSKPDYPKHLLKVNGDDLSLLQHTYERAKRVASSVYIVSEISHIEHVKDQLPELSEEAFIVEPGRRGTANCIVAALAAITGSHPPDEPVAFMHADHYIRDIAGFEYSFEIAANATVSNKQIVLVGVEPDHPATGFGYIKKGALQREGGKLVFGVDAFQEKPDYETAQKYWRSGEYLWNCGYFVATIDVFLRSMHTYAPTLRENYEVLCRADENTYEKTYLSFESNAIDYALIEKVEDLLVIPASFDWMDLGSFTDMHKAVGGDQNGNHTHGSVELDEVENSFIHNNEDKPLAVIGLDNVVVVNTPHGIVVIRKDLSQRIGDISKRFTTPE